MFDFIEEIQPYIFFCGIKYTHKYFPLQPREVIRVLSSA